jgi:H+/gluconate symporter-like permease
VWNSHDTLLVVKLVVATLVIVVLVARSFGMSVKDTFKTWSAMETPIPVVGLGGVMALSAVV